MRRGSIVIVRSRAAFKNANNRNNWILQNSRFQLERELTVALIFRGNIWLCVMGDARSLVSRNMCCSLRGGGWVHNRNHMIINDWEAVTYIICLYVCFHRRWRRSRDLGDDRERGKDHCWIAIRCVFFYCELLLCYGIHSTTSYWLRLWRNIYPIQPPPPPPQLSPHPHMWNTNEKTYNGGSLKVAGRLCCLATLLFRALFLFFAPTK